MRKCTKEQRALQRLAEDLIDELGLSAEEVWDARWDSDLPIRSQIAEVLPPDLVEQYGREDDAVNSVLFEMSDEFMRRERDEATKGMSAAEAVEYLGCDDVEWDLVREAMQEDGTPE